MKTKLKQNFLLICLVMVLVLPFFVFAASQDTPTKKLQSFSQDAGYETNSNSDSNALPAYAGKLVKIVYSILGIIFTFLIILAGYNYMTARGDESKTKEALKTIRNSVIGLIIMISAWAIYTFAWSSLTQ